MDTWKRTGLMCLALLALGLAPVGAAYAQVKVTSATPSSAAQGTISLDVVVSGSGFDRTATAQYFVSGTTNTGGITVKGTKFNSSTELVTTIEVADTAVLANFDIVVTLNSGRKGKGTTLFAVTAKSTGPAATPTYPPGRFYHGFASNGGTTAATSRLYMFGGAANGGADLGDLWSYANAGSTGATWTFISGGTSVPSVRHLMGWSCGGGQCVMVNGWRGSSWVKETWVFNESTQTWSQATCGRRALCPSYRAGPTMAYDPPHGVHVLFGGEGDGDPMLLADTFLFNAGTRTWKQVSGGVAPPAREAAAAVYVPGVGVVMSGGWGNPCCITTLNDMYVWNGVAWASVASSVVSDPPRAVPALANHSMAWDATRNSLIVTGGFLTSWHMPNEETWYVTFSNSAGAWRATWTLASGIGCQSAAGSPPDSTVHAGAKMAYDPVVHVQVFFGGESADGSSSYGNTVECQ
jgi:hypothetical protein